MAGTFIPRPDGDFDAWSENFVFFQVKFWGNEGFDPPGLLPLQTAQTAWEAAYAAQVAAAAAARAASAAKDAARADFERAARIMAAYTQTYPIITDADRAQMGISVSDGERTTPAAPTSRPAVSILLPERLTHTLRLSDESTPTRKARPKGTRGAEIWLKLVAPGESVPTDPRALSYLALATRPIYRASFAAEDGNKTAVYMLRWVNTRGEKGPWSEIATATVAA